MLAPYAIFHVEFILRYSGHLQYYKERKKRSETFVMLFYLEGCAQTLVPVRERRACDVPPVSRQQLLECRKTGAWLVQRTTPGFVLGFICQQFVALVTYDAPPLKVTQVWGLTVQWVDPYAKHSKRAFFKVASNAVKFAHCFCICALKKAKLSYQVLSAIENQ